MLLPIEDTFSSCLLEKEGRHCAEYRRTASEKMCDLSPYSTSSMTESIRHDHFRLAATMHKLWLWQESSEIELIR